MFDKLTTATTRPFTVKLLAIESANQGNTTECGTFLPVHFEDIVGALSRLRKGLTPFEYEQLRRPSRVAARLDMEYQRLPRGNDITEVDRARECRTNLYATLFGTLSCLSFKNCLHLIGQ